MSHILAIDPGNIESACVILEKDTYRPVYFFKKENSLFRDEIPKLLTDYPVSKVIIEKIESYGMAVGRSVFDTCVWIGRYVELFMLHKKPVFFMYRKDIKLNLCGQVRAKDTNIRVALIDRFAEFDLKNGKGTKKDPDFFYGFAKDMWAAMAVGVTFIDDEKLAERVYD